MANQPFDPDLYTKMGNFTKRYYRDTYPALSPTNPSMSASGKIALIAGSSRGIGRVCAVAFAQFGAAGVVVTSRKLEDLAGVSEDIKKISGGKTEVLAVAAEITKSEDVKNVFEKAKARFGRLDVVVANAGLMGQGSAFPKIGEWEPERWWYDMEVNVRGAYLTAHHFIKTFGPRGTFVTMTSGAGTITLPGLSSYGMSKFADIHLVEFLHVEYPELRSFSMNPGIVTGIADAAAFVPFAFDTQALVGSFAVWLSTPRADCVRGGYVSDNWDVEELERNGKEIQEKGLLRGKFLGGILGPEGYAFGR